jgi:Ulp1 family protease
MKKTDICTIAKKFDTTILASNLKKLRPITWLNDEVINFYVRLLETHVQTVRTPMQSKIMFQNSFFFETLNNGKDAKRWMKTVQKRNKYLDTGVDCIVFLVHLSLHWVVGVIDLLSKTVMITDSYNDSKDEECETLLSAIPKLFPKEDISKWRMISLHPFEQADG